jgi:hypothetical protein
VSQSSSNNPTRLPIRGSVDAGTPLRWAGSRRRVKGTAGELGSAEGKATKEEDAEMARYSDGGTCDASGFV